MAGTMAMATPFGMRNRVINGAMVIDQRNAGAAVDGAGGTQTWPVDRFYSQLYNTSGNTTGQQSTTAPSGFINSMKISVKTADTSVGSTDQVWYGQNIEGLNLSDFGLGTSSAVTFTISFWVYSNVTGTYCVCLKNSAENRTYVAEYTINSSATWEKKTITVVGDTTGTWLTTNGTGLKVWFILMAGSGVTTSANSWSAASAIATTNQVNFMSSTSNYWHITGVQLERGTQATPFEWRPYTTELQLAQRYYEKSYNIADKPGTITDTNRRVTIAYNVVDFYDLGTTRYAVTKRADPTVTIYSPVSGASGVYANLSSGTTAAATPFSAGQTQFFANGNGNTLTATNVYSWHWTSSAEL